MAENGETEEFDSLMNEARRLLDENEPEKALEIGRRLEKMCYSGGFEIQALAYCDLDQKKKAVKVLEKGTRTVPEVWLLWQLLGNYRSDLGRYAKAYEAYEAGLAQEGGDRCSLNSNYALALLRQGEMERAEKVIARVLQDPDFEQAHPDLQILTHRAHVEILHGKGQDEEVIAYVRNLSFEEVESDVVVHLAGILARCAHALWRRGRAAEAKWELAKAIAEAKYSENVQWAFREIYGGRGDEELDHYRLLIRGTWSVPFEEGEPLPQFYTTYEVVAEDEDEALEFVRAFEPAAIRDSLLIEESEILGRQASKKGVYTTGGYSFFPGT